MTPMRYVVTGGTGFIGRRVVSKLLRTHPDDEVGVLVRRPSLGRFERLAEDWGDRAKPLVGDLAEPHLGLTDELGGVKHVVHCGAIYDITMREEAQRGANVDGTRSVIELARRLGATLHHVSSIAVAGDFRGEYTEAAEAKRRRISRHSFRRGFERLRRPDRMSTRRSPVAAVSILPT